MSTQYIKLLGRKDLAAQMIWAWPSKSHSQSHVVIYFPPSHLSPTPPLPSSRHSTPLMSPKEMLPCQELPFPLADGRPSEPLAHLALLSAALTWSFHGDGTCSHKLWLVARTDNNQIPSSCISNPRGREMLTGVGVLLPFSPLTQQKPGVPCFWGLSYKPGQPRASSILP